MRAWEDLGRKRSFKVTVKCNNWHIEDVVGVKQQLQRSPPSVNVRVYVKALLLPTHLKRPGINNGLDRLKVTVCLWIRWYGRLKLFVILCGKSWEWNIHTHSLSIIHTYLIKFTSTKSPSFSGKGTYLNIQCNSHTLTISSYLILSPIHTFTALLPIHGLSLSTTDVPPVSSPPISWFSKSASFGPDLQFMFKISLNTFDQSYQVL